MIITCAIEKGGEGKSTTAIVLSSYLALSGYKTLLIDLEPQGNSASVVSRVDAPSFTLRDIIVGNMPVRDALSASKIDNLYVISGSPALVELDAHLRAQPAGNYALRDVIEQSGIDREFDWIIIDTPPGLGPLLFNALSASDYVIIPLQCAAFSIDGLTRLEATIKQVARLNPNLEILGAYINKYKPLRNITKVGEAEIENYFKDLLFKTRVRESTKVEEAALHRQPIFFYALKDAVTDDFAALCQEVLARIRAKHQIPVPEEV